jgi:hypothetical protein
MSGELREFGQEYPTKTVIYSASAAALSCYYATSYPHGRERLVPGLPYICAPMFLLGLALVGV